MVLASNFSREIIIYSDYNHKHVLSYFLKIRYIIQIQYRGDFIYFIYMPEIDISRNALQKDGVY